MNKYYLHYIGSKLYPKEIFIKEAKEIGVNRCLPLNMIGKLKWGDKILIGNFLAKDTISEKELCPKCRIELEHIQLMNVNQGNFEDVFGCPKCLEEVDRDKSIKEKIDKRKNKKGGTAKVFGYFIISGLNMTASEEFKQNLTSQLEIVETNNNRIQYNRRCGNYTIGISHIIKNSLEDIIEKAKNLSKQMNEKVKFFVAGYFYPLSLDLTPINFSRTLISVNIETELNTVNNSYNKEVGFIYDYNKRAYIKKKERENG
jgi:hypothetical protein